jgi:hypothetical protein
MSSNDDALYGEGQNHHTELLEFSSSSSNDNDNMTSVWNELSAWLERYDGEDYNYSRRWFPIQLYVITARGF